MPRNDPKQRFTIRKLELPTLVFVPQARIRFGRLSGVKLRLGSPSRGGRDGNATRLTHQSLTGQHLELAHPRRAVFYSSPIYSAIRLFVSTSESGRSLDEIIERFEITRPKASKLIQFLRETGLIEEVDGHYKMGAAKHASGKRLSSPRKASCELENESYSICG